MAGNSGERGSLRPPDYGGGSLLNLMASIVEARGRGAPHPPLKDLPPAMLARAANLVYLVIDGLGAQQLDRALEKGVGTAFFGRFPRRILTTVWPATTAAVVTTLSTAASPAEHAVLGWHLLLPELGLEATILLGLTRTEVPIAPRTLDLRRYLDVPDHLKRVPGTRTLLSYRRIAHSRYSRAVGSWTRRGGYSTLRGLRRRMTNEVRRPGRKLIYAYWPLYDTLCHKYGTGHRRTLRHLEHIDQELSALVENLADTDTVLVVTADHGLVDNLPEQAVDLSRIPGLMDCLTIIPAGDARQCACFVRPAREKQFREIVARHLGHCCRRLSAEEILKDGYLGPGRPHPALRRRLADYILLPDEGVSFHVPVPGVKTELHKADHGGMSCAEMDVPLYVVDCG